MRGPTLSSCPPRTPATGNRFQAHDGGRPEGLHVAQKSASLAETPNAGPAPPPVELQPPLAQVACGGTGCPLAVGRQGPAQAQTPAPRPPESRNAQEKQSKEDGGDSPG